MPVDMKKPTKPAKPIKPLTHPAHSQSLQNRNSTGIRRCSSLRLQKREATVFRCIRFKQSGLIPHYKFSFLFQGKELFRAEGKGMSLANISITNSSTDLADDVLAILEIANRRRSFTLRNNLNEVISKIEFNEPGNFQPREVHVTVFMADGTEVQMNSRKPIFDSKKKVYRISFSGHFVIPSIKNCILEREKDVDGVVIRKIESNSLEIESYENFDPLIVFAISAASYLSP